MCQVARFLKWRTYGAKYTFWGVLSKKIKSRGAKMQLS